MSTGLRQSAALAVSGAIVGDFVFQQGSQGIGVLLRTYTLRLYMEPLFLAIIFTALFGVVVFSIFATLDRLQAALAVGHAPSPRETRALAEHLLTEAHRLALADAVPVQSAAPRPAAVRRHDHDEVTAEVAHARPVPTDAELPHGATPLLAATSARATVASLIITLPSATLMATGWPRTVSADSSLTTSAAMTLPATTW